MPLLTQHHSAISMHRWPVARVRGGGGLERSAGNARRCKRGWRMQVLSEALSSSTTEWDPYASSESVPLVLCPLHPFDKQFARLASFFAINSPAAMCSQPVSMLDNILRSICKNSEPRLVYRTTAMQLSLHRATIFLVCGRDPAPRVVVLSTGAIATHSDSVLRS